MRSTWFRLVGVVVVLLLLIGSLTGCFGGGKEKASAKSRAGSIRINVTASPRELSRGNRNSGELSVEIENLSNKDIEVDVWVDVLPGIRFVEQSRQSVSEDGQRAMRSAVLMRPLESRVVEFKYQIAQQYDLGVYVIEVNASTSTEDLATAKIEVEVVE